MRWRGLVQTTCEHSRRMRTTSARAPFAYVRHTYRHSHSHSHSHMPAAKRGGFSRMSRAPLYPEAKREPNCSRGRILPCTGSGQRPVFRAYHRASAVCSSLSSLQSLYSLQIWWRRRGQWLRQPHVSGVRHTGLLLQYYDATHGEKKRVRKRGLRHGCLMHEA